MDVFWGGGIFYRGGGCVVHEFYYIIYLGLSGMYGIVWCWYAVV